MSELEGTSKVKDMLLKIKNIVDIQREHYYSYILEYDTDLIITINNISKVVERELQEFF